MKHKIYLFKQVFEDGREMIARWSPTIDRRYIKPFHPQSDQNAINYLNYFGWPEIKSGEDPRLMPVHPFEEMEIHDDRQSD
jgi:hypothetical protein